MFRYWIKHREAVIVIVSLLIFGGMMLSLMYSIIEEYPFISLTVCLISLAVYDFIARQIKNKNYGK